MAISSAKDRLSGIKKYFNENKIAISKQDIYTVKIGNSDNSD